MRPRRVYRYPMKVPVVSFHVRFPPSVFEKLRTQADRHHRSIAAEILTIVEEAMEGAPAPPPRPAATAPAPQHAATPAPRQAIAKPAPDRVPDPPAPPAAPHRAASDYERFCRVLKHTQSLHGVIDASGWYSVNAEEIRTAYISARVSEGATDNSNAHKAGFYKQLTRLVTEGAIERNGSIIRILNLP
jgi:plasmid stability protein